MASILIDASAILAIIDPAAAHHASAARTLEDVRAAGHSVFFTNFLRSETYTVLAVRLGGGVARRWLSSLVTPVEPVLPEDEGRAIAILLGYGDKTFSFVDATSFAVMERLRVRTAFTFDKHFRQFGFEVLPAR